MTKQHLKYLYYFLQALTCLAIIANAAHHW